MGKLLYLARLGRGTCIFGLEGLRTNSSSHAFLLAPPWMQGALFLAEAAAKGDVGSPGTPMSTFGSAWAGMAMPFLPDPLCVHPAP